MLQDSSTVAKIIYAYNERFKLDVLIHMCQKKYVGHNSVDNHLSTKYLCCLISYLIQEWRDSNGNTICKSPGDLFNKFSGYQIVSLRVPDSGRFSSDLRIIQH